MNRTLAAALVALSIALGVGAGFGIQRVTDEPAAAGKPPTSSTSEHTKGTTPSSSPSTKNTPTTPTSSSLRQQNDRDRFAAHLPSWSPADPTGTDGNPLVLGNITLGGIGEIRAGQPILPWVSKGYFEEIPPPCDGDGRTYKWAGQYSEGMLVSTDAQGNIAALGFFKDTPVTADGIGVGSSVAALKRTYGDWFNAPVASDSIGSWTYVKEQDRWIAFNVEGAQPGKITDRSRVTMVTVGVGKPGEYFNGDC